MSDSVNSRSLFGLFDENGAIDPADIRIRGEIAAALSREIPDSWWGRVEYLQVQVGCHNLCSFCSQTAGSWVWQLDERSLRNVLSGIRGAAVRAQTRGGQHSSAPLLGADRVEHKPGVIFPYLDNDVFSYPHLDTLVSVLGHDFNCRVRLTSVGFSRHNPLLRITHSRIARDSAGYIDGLRFSFTPYTLGWAGGESPTSPVSREEFLRDVAHTVETYRPVIDALGPGKDRACFELRFPPLVIPVPEGFTELIEGAGSLLFAGPLICRTSVPISTLPVATISRLEGRRPIYSQPPSRCVVLFLPIDGEASFKQRAIEFLKTAAPLDLPDRWTEVSIAGQSVLVRSGELYKFSNSDGPYLALSPFFSSRKQFDPIHLYPATGARKCAGILLSSRFLMNEIVITTSEEERRKPGLDYSWKDVDGVISRLSDKQRMWAKYAPEVATHLGLHLIPMVTAYREILLTAGLKPSYFFDRNFTIDTGEIVNQGRATSEFKGLVSAPGIPLTPHAERGYGDVSFNALRGNVIRISISPLNQSSHRLGIRQLGRRNTARGRSALHFEELDGWLRPTGISKTIECDVSLTVIQAAELQDRLQVPGAKPHESAQRVSYHEGDSSPHEGGTKG